MKQAISIDQLKELSEKGLVRYRGYIEGKYVDVLDYIYSDGKPVDFADYKVGMLPLLSIGQMVEFLNGYMEGMDDFIVGIVNQKKEDKKEQIVSEWVEVIMRRFSL